MFCTDIGTTAKNGPNRAPGRTRGMEQQDLSKQGGETKR
ncbi:hypothetical protein I656_02398 [Geobacillus sp. WSUCF1]|nr:hypothetical protein I656_02398 [Geobacillus sp. WSUCF1]